MKTLIVIPTYNEAENIERIIKAIFRLKNENISVLVVDDHSPDGTAGIVKKIAESNSHVHLIERDGKYGLGTAYVRGFKYALKKDYDFIMEMDADFSHDPKEIKQFLKHIQTQ